MNRILPALSLAAAFAAAPAFADALDSAAATGGALAAGISEEEAALTDVWQGKIAIGAETRSGNTEQDGVNGSFEMRKLQGETIVLFSVNGAWEQQETEDADGANRRDERTVGNASADLNLKQRLGGFFVYGDLAGLHDQPYGWPCASLDQRVVHSGHGQKRRYPPEVHRPTIAQHDDLRAAVHGFESLPRKVVQGGFKSVLEEHRQGGSRVSAICDL